MKGRIYESEYEESVDQVTSKSKTHFDDIDQLKTVFLYDNEENKINRNGITSTNISMDMVKGKMEENKGIQTFTLSLQ